MRPRLVLAALALLLALGLPWGVVGAQTVYVPGWVLAPYCSLDYDGWMVCTAGFVSPGYVLPGQGATYAGYQTAARVTIVLGLILLAHWSRRGGSWQLPTAALLQVVAVALAGTALRSGAVAALIAAALLLTTQWRPRAGSVHSSVDDDSRPPTTATGAPASA